MEFSINEKHILCLDGKPVTQRPTPNRGGKMNTRRFLVCHFTSGSTAAGAIDWLTDPDAKASAHFVISRTDGKVTQLAPCNVQCWHAGKSKWTYGGKTYDGLNSCSIGIEFDNMGRLMKAKDGGWVTDFGKKITTEGVLVAPHKNDPPNATASGWHTFSEVQLAVGLAVAEALVQRYNLDEVVGHDDIAPKRKDDPGPAFPMDDFKALVTT